MHFSNLISHASSSYSEHCSQLQQLNIWPDYNSSTSVQEEQQQELDFLRPLQQTLGNLSMSHNGNKTTITNSSANANKSCTVESTHSPIPNLIYARAIHALLFRILRFYEHTLGQIPVLPLPDPFAIAQLPLLKLLRCQSSSIESPLVQSLATSGRSSPQPTDKNVHSDFSRLAQSSPNVDVEIVAATTVDFTESKSSDATKEQNSEPIDQSENVSTVHSDLELIDCQNQNHCDEHPDQPEQHLHTLLLLLLGCAVQCDRKQQFIERIKQLDLHTQHALVSPIKRVTDNPICMWPAAEWSSLSSVPDMTPERVYHLLLSHLKEVCTQRQQLLARCTHLLDGLNRSKNACAHCPSSTVNPLSNSDCLGSCSLHCGLHSITSLTSEDRSITALDDSSTGTPNHHGAQRLTVAAAEQLLQQFRSQLREARAELDERAEQLTETQEQLRQCRESNAKQAAEHVRLSQQAREAKMYRDEVDVLNERLRAMQAAEEELDRYRARRTEFERAQRQCQQLMEENRLLTEAKQVCQEQLNRAQQRFDATTELETQMVQARACVAELKAQRDDDRQRLSALCDRIAELEAERRRTDERLADCQAQLRAARLAATSASGNHSASGKLNQNGLLKAKLSKDADHGAQSVISGSTCSIAQPESLDLTSVTLNGRPLGGAATGSSLLEQLNNENAKRLLQLEIENQKLQCALAAEQAKKAQKRLDASNNSSDLNKPKSQSNEPDSNQTESTKTPSEKSSKSRFGVLEVAQHEDTQPGNSTENTDLSPETVAIGSTCTQSEHTSESDSGCVSLVGESTCIKRSRSVSDRLLPSLAAVHLCNNQPLRSDSSASTSSGSADSSTGCPLSGSSGHNSEEESNGSLPATDQSIIFSSPSSRRDLLTLKASPVARTSASTALLRPIRQVSETRLQSPRKSTEHHKTSESLPVSHKVHTIVQVCVY